MKSLFSYRGTMPFLSVIFLNSFVDLGHKITLQNTFIKLYDGGEQLILTALINAMILLPYVLLLSPAGFLSDRFKRPDVLRYAAFFALLTTIGIAASYAMGWFKLAFAMTLLLAAQSAIVYPAKFGYIRELYGKERLGEGNGWVAAVTIVAILIGSLAFSVLFETLFDVSQTTKGDVLEAMLPLGYVLIASAALEWIASLRLPAKFPANPNLHFDSRRFVTGQLFAQDLLPLKRSDVIRLCAVGLATFWSVGQVMLAAFPAFFKERTGVDNTIVIQACLACSGIGIALGSTFSGRLSRDHIETGVLPISAIGIAAGLLWLGNVASPTTAAMAFLFIGFMGGMFIVPLNALVQFTSQEAELGKTLAATNWVQNLSMLAFLAITVAFGFMGLSSRALILLMAVVALIGSIYTVYKLPQSLIRLMLTYLLSRRYRVQVQGLEHIPAKGGVLLLGNHISWIDWAIMQLASPRPVRFVMIRKIYEKWYLTWFFDLFGVIPIEQGPRSRKSLLQIAEILDRGHVVCLFPEGTISRTGHLAEFRKGFERALAQTTTEVAVIPFFMRGLWGSQFSRSSARLKAAHKPRTRRDLVIAFGAPLAQTISAAELKTKVFDLSIVSWRSYVRQLEPLSQRFIRSCKDQARRIILSDTMGYDLSGIRTLTGAKVLARLIRQRSQGKSIGILMPTSAVGMLANMGGVLANKTLVNLNYTASEKALIAAIETSGLTEVYTSTKFVKRLNAKGFHLDFLKERVKFIYLEEAMSAVSKAQKVRTLLATALLPVSVQHWLQKRANRETEEQSTRPAVILFSSGSESLPKGIAISEQNIQANVMQIFDVLNPSEDDVLMANLPLFHAFGLTCSQFMPLLQGIPVICHPDPTDVLGSAKAVAKYKATLMFGTSSFFRLYVRNHKVKGLMLDSLRYVIGGAEKLSQDVRRDFKLKFNKDIFEGYGATETTPVASVNLPDKLSIDDWKIQTGNRIGSVGMPLPGTSVRIADPETLEALPNGESGMILIGGEQVMMGYLQNDALTEEVIKTIDGIRWYLTFDKGRVDEDGFLYIEDRYSRFAKIAGEMVSLTNVEEALRAVIDDEETDLVCVALPDDKKGETIICLVDQPLDSSDTNSALRDNGLVALALPSRYLTISEVPKLGSGKTDFATAKSLARQLIEEAD